MREIKKGRKHEREDKTLIFSVLGARPLVWDHTLLMTAWWLPTEYR